MRHLEKPIWKHKKPIFLQPSMLDKKPKIRIIVRPWTPRKIPEQIPTSRINEVLVGAYPKLKEILYVGWIRRKVKDKKQLFFLAATGTTSTIARKAFKESEDFGSDIWLISS